VARGASIHSISRMLIGKAMLLWWESLVSFPTVDLLRQVMLREHPQLFTDPRHLDWAGWVKHCEQVQATPEKPASTAP